VLKSLIQTMPVLLTLQSLGIDTGGVDIPTLARNYMSRENERRADQDALMLMNRTGLNASCAEGFFTRHASGFEKYIAALSTHPTSEERTHIMRTQGEHNDKPCTPFVR